MKCHALFAIYKSDWILLIFTYLDKIKTYFTKNGSFSWKILQVWQIRLNKMNKILWLKVFNFI